MKLVIINGPTGVGKSTVAKLLHQEMPMSFLLDVDEQRRHLSHYRDHREESGKLCHAVGQAIVRTCFAHGRDVIIEKLILKDEILDAYRAIADENRATNHEYILWAPKQLVLDRAHARGWRPDGLLTPEKCELFWDRMDAFKGTRRQAKILDITTMDPEQVKDAMVKKIQQFIMSQP